MKKDYKELTRQAYIDAYRYEVKNTAYDGIDDEYFYGFLISLRCNGIKRVFGILSQGVGLLLLLA